MMMVVNTVWWVSLPIRLSETDNILVLACPTSLTTGGALEGVAFATRCGRNFVDQMLYHGHSPRRVEEGGD